MLHFGVFRVPFSTILAINGISSAFLFRLIGLKVILRRRQDLRFSARTRSFIVKGDGSDKAITSTGDGFNVLVLRVTLMTFTESSSQCGDGLSQIPFFNYRIGPNETHQ